MAMDSREESAACANGLKGQVGLSSAISMELATLPIIKSRVAI